jgi:hypothetical protein
VRRFVPFALCIAAAVLVSGCGPTITVYNRTRIPVRAQVFQGKQHAVVNPSPGESSTVDADLGPYVAIAEPEEDWLRYAKLTQKVLNESLADPSRLTGPQITDIVQRLKDIVERIQQYEGAGGRRSSCRGKITEKEPEAHSVNVDVGVTGTLVATCR